MNTQQVEITSGGTVPQLDTELNLEAVAGAHRVTVTVFAPSHLKPKHFNFKTTLTVGDAATEAATKFHVDVEAPTFQKGDEVLDRTKTLATAGVKDGDELDLVSAGGGV